MVWEDGDDTDIAPWPAHAPDVTETDNPVVAVLYGPTGEVLVEHHERPVVPFGYQAPERKEPRPPMQ